MPEWTSDLLGGESLEDCQAPSAPLFLAAGNPPPEAQHFQ
jgi:hypothetical protein